MAGRGTAGGGALLRHPKSALEKKVAAIVSESRRSLASDSEATLASVKKGLEEDWADTRGKIGSAKNDKERQKLILEARAIKEASRRLDEEFANPRRLKRIRQIYQVEDGRNTYFRTETKRRQAAIDFFRQSGLDSSVPEQSLNSLNRVRARAKKKKPLFFSVDS